MPAQIIVTRMARPDIEKKIAELQANDVIAIVPHAGKGCLVQSKIPVPRRGPELDRAYAALQTIANADAAIGAQRLRARGINLEETAETESAPPAPQPAPQPKKQKPGPQKPGPQG